MIAWRSYFGSMLARIGLKGPILAALSWRHERQMRRQFPILKPIDQRNLELLAEDSFQDSVREVASLTLLDTARLANLWSLCRATDRTGAILEVGSYRGGAALHLSNCCPSRLVIACDSFASFESIDPVLDRQFEKEQFRGARREDVARLFTMRGRQARVYAGFFPASVSGEALPKISFVHLDVDVLKATRESLFYLLRSDLLMDRSLIVLDDYRRMATGVDRAVDEVLHDHPDWTSLPLFPGQGVLIPKTFFER